MADRETARQWYAKAAAVAKGTPLEGEATLRIAATYVQTYQKESILKGLDILHTYLEGHPATSSLRPCGSTWARPTSTRWRTTPRRWTATRRPMPWGCWKRGEGPVYWRMAVLADRYLKDRDTAIEYYKKIITKTPTSGKAYEAQLALKKLGVEPPKIELFDIVASKQNSDAAATPTGQDGGCCKVSNEDSPKKGIGRWLNMNVFGGLLLIGATIASLMQVFSTQKKLFDPDVTIIRISHWQLRARLLRCHAARD